ncbi:hypothetical protein COLO4_26731 [Corchorus olitorius]|uniref:Uncharacterized protein n=1 Tax=Corchorus olitorius TaxID=93759 RepID=A0A1R3HV44_9ROSI|nr:hypothetical protein COLO4_26731 [Corchorus olitorius]
MDTPENRFWTCDYARALWFASSLGLRTDAFLDINLRQWLLKWLGIEEINGKENHWFVVEFTYTLWYIWIQRNEKIFQGKESNPTGIMSRIKRTMTKVTEAFGMEWQEHQQSPLYVNLLKPRVAKFVSSRAIQGLPALNQGSWLLFLLITKLQDNAWFGVGMIARNYAGETRVMMRSIQVEDKLKARIIIARYSLQRMVEAGAEELWIRKKDKNWKNALTGRTQVEWKLFPIVADIRTMLANL